MSGGDGPVPGAPVRGLLLDLDGTVYENDAVVPGADAAIVRLREEGRPVRFVTNTTRVPCDTIAGWLEGYGIPTEPDHVFTPPRAAVEWLAGQGLRRVAVCLPPASFSEFSRFEIVDEDPEAVVVGATLVGKPSRAMFEAAARSMDLPLGEVAMVGDDLQSDVGGSQALGIRGILVQTGKYRAAEVEASSIEPDRVVPSIAVLPDLLLSSP